MDHQQFLQLHQILIAQGAKIDQLWAIMLQMQSDFGEFKGRSAYFSSSGSSGRYLCPLRCPADFKKVRVMEKFDVWRVTRDV